MQWFAFFAKMLPIKSVSECVNSDASFIFLRIMLSASVRGYSVVCCFCHPENLCSGYTDIACHSRYPILRSTNWQLYALAPGKEHPKHIMKPEMSHLIRKPAGSGGIQESRNVEKGRNFNVTPPHRRHAQLANHPSTTPTPSIPTLPPPAGQRYTASESASESVP